MKINVEPILEPAAASWFAGRLQLSRNTKRLTVGVEKVFYA